MRPVARPCISEAAVQAVAAVLRSGWITSGPKVVEFEQAFATAPAARLRRWSAVTALRREPKDPAQVYEHWWSTERNGTSIS
jgi:hypothetical protein